MTRTLLLMCVASCFAVTAQAQQAPCYVVDGAVVPPCGAATRSEQQPADDPFARYFFPPELVMAHQQDINLTDRQRAAIQEAMKEAQGKFVDLQFKMSGEAETLKKLISGPSVDETRTLEQVDRILALERTIKTLQVKLMIRIKNQLTEQQQAALAKLR